MGRFLPHTLRYVTSLDGMWDFAWLGDLDPDGVDTALLSFSEQMAVPGCFDATPQYAGRRGLAAYRTVVTLLDGAPHRLVFNAVHHWCRVFASGRCLGEHAGGFTRFNVDLPPQEAGEVEVVVLVDNRFNAERCPLHMPHFDWYQFGGITRPVELHRLGALWIEACKLTTERIQPPALKVQLDYRLNRPNGEVPLSIFWNGRAVLQEKVALAEAGGRLERLLELPGAELWSPEAPRLHMLEVRLGGDDLRQRVGLRQVRVAGRQLLLNEQPLRLAGFNRHEAHPQFGHALPEQVLVADLQQLRDMGCNFVRGSHYPQDERFLDLCDEAGLCVWSEGTGWQHTAEQLTDERFLAAQQAMLEEMVAVAQNHPSVILYGILNESLTTDPAARRSYARLFGRLRELDCTRPLTFATNHVFEDLCLDLADVISVNTYPGWYHAEIEAIPGYLDSVAQHLDEIGQGNKPLILSEIGAAAVPGWRDWNEDRWSEQYQARLLETVIRHLFFNAEQERFNGLAIWQFSDIRTGGGVQRMLTRARGFNNKGVLDEYRRPKQAYGVVKELFNKLT